MAIYAVRVKETTTGTGAYSLDGPATGFRSFVAGTSNGAVVTYICEDGINWEIGEGTVTAGSPDTLSRTTILDSSNSGATVNWGIGLKSIFLTGPGSRLVTKDKINTLTLGVASTSTTAVNVARQVVARSRWRYPSWFWCLCRSCCPTPHQTARSTRSGANATPNGRTTK